MRSPCPLWVISCRDDCDARRPVRQLSAKSGHPLDVLAGAEGIHQ